MNADHRFLQKESHLRIAIAFLLSTLVGTGLYLRLHNLGELGLVIDEGIQALGLQGILKYGVPKVDSGVIYSRALPYFYLQAAFAKLFQADAFWLRLPSALFGAGVIILSYLLGKTLFNRSVGLLAAIIIAFSTWEIELSRYARFYTTFQFMFLLSLLFFYRGFMLDRGKDKIFFLFAALIAFSTHSLGNVIATLFLIAFFSPAFSLNRKLIFGLWAIALFGIWKFYGKFVGFVSSFGDPLHYVESGGSGNPNLIDKIRTVAGLPPLHPPNLSVFKQTLQQQPVLITALALILLAATIYLVYRAFQGDRIGQILLAILMLWLVFIYKFGLFLIALSIYLIFFWRDFRDLKQPVPRVVGGAATVCMLFWFIMIPAQFGITVKAAFWELFDYPRFYEYFLYWYVKGWPVMTLVFSLGCLLLLARLISNRIDPVPLFILGAIFIPAIFTSFLKTYLESRYSFHLYPLIVIVFSVVIVKGGAYVFNKILFKKYWSRGLVVSVMVVGALFLSQDANPLRAWAIGNRTYQSEKDPFRSVISWKFYARFHQDHKNPSIYIKEHLSPGDQIVCLGSIYMIGLYHFYTGKVDYALAPSGTPNYYGMLKNGKTVNYITGSEILAGSGEIQNLIEHSSAGIWLLGDRILLAEEIDFYSPPIKDYLRSLAHTPDYVGLDGQTFAVKIH